MQYPVDNANEDDLIKEYNTARPCTKEYNIYRLKIEFKNKWNKPLKSVCRQQLTVSFKKITKIDQRRCRKFLLVKQRFRLLKPIVQKRYVPPDLTLSVRLRGQI